MLRRAIVLIALASVSLTSCSRALFIQPSGSFDSGVRFQFFRDIDRSTTDKYRVTLIRVAQLDRDGGETEFWKLTGEARLSGIEYGAMPTGLSGETPARPLVSDGVYLIEVHEKPFAIGMSLLRFSDMGKVEECRTLPECFADE